MKKVKILISIVIVIIIVSFLAKTIIKKRIVFDSSRLSPTIVNQIIKPKTINELQEIIKNTSKPIAIAGAKYSQGGQVAFKNGITIDMSYLNKIIKLDKKEKLITVQTGITWSKIQKYIDPYNLSIKVMQSYNDFSVGGSLSVNVHGRDPYGSLIKTIKEIKVLIADGSIITANKNENSSLFFGAIGGYGLLGIITEASIELTENIKIERKINLIDTIKYKEFFFEKIYKNKDVIFHNANIYPNEFKKVMAITWHKTTKEITEKNRLQQENSYVKEKLEEQILRRFTPAKNLRQEIEKITLNKPLIVWRNHEMSYSVKSLEPLWRFPTTSILQEYFIPIRNFYFFVEKFKKIIQQHDVNVLNVSIRFVKKDSESILNYAKEDCFAFVCYINVKRSITQIWEQTWTRQLIQQAINLEGTYYLPYHLYATKKQFEQAYPKFNKFLKLKKKYDPNNKFRNNLLSKYLD